MRTWIRWALPAVLAVAVAGPAPAQTSSPPPDRNSELVSQLHKLTAELASLRGEIEQLRKDLKDAAGREARAPLDVRDLQQRLESIQNALNRQDDAVRRALSINPQALPGAGPPAAPATGTIVLRNRSLVNGTFIVNGRPYTVPAGSAATVERVPAGTFTYEIDAEGFGVLRPMTSRVLSAGQTFYLNIDPQS
jgi:hypothetical protein